MPSAASQTPPPEQTRQAPTYEQAAAAFVGAEAYAAAGATTAGAGATAKAEAAGFDAIRKAIIAPILDLARTRWNVLFDPSGPVAETVRAEYPGRDFRDVMDIVDERERAFEREFRRKMRKRLEADLPEVLAETDPEKRADKLAKIFKREMRYTAMREEAILSRAMGAIEADMLQTLSPKGAYWKLSPHVKEHTLDCLAMGEKFWPWSVLRKVQPPLHYGCPCYLLGLDEVVEMGLMSEDQVPDESDARARYGRIADKIDDLRDLGEAAIDELYEAAYENLTESPVRGARKPLRWAKGFVKGGQFRPTRGSSPGLRVLDLPESPARQRGAGRGRWTWVNGTYTKIPEADAWTRTVGERTYHSPPGGTNLYVNGKLANEPGDPSAPAERVKRSVGTPTVPPELAAKADAARAKLRDDAATGRGVPPISVGDGPSAVLALPDAGFRLESARSGGKHRRSLTFRASSGTLVVDMGEKGVVADLKWEPARPKGERVPLDRPAFNWEEHASDSLAYADELGRKYGADVKVPQIFADETMHDHAGTHLWSGEIKVGKDTPKDIDRSGRKRQAGKALSEDEKRGVYASYWVTGHEIAHGVNPIQPQYFNGANANLEEALAEEMGHKLALDRLARHGQYDVIDWRFRNPDALAVRGVYPNERAALAKVFDEAGVPDGDREALIEKLAFRVRPESRLQYLATLVAVKGDGDVEAARERVEGILARPEKAPPEFRAVINPRQLRRDVPAHYGEWDWSGREARWSPDEDALADAVAAIQNGGPVLTVGDQVPVVKYADGSFGVGDPHGSTSDELTFAANAAEAAETALGRSDYATIHSGGYKSEKGSDSVSPAQSASDNAMLYFAQHSGAPVPASPGVAPSRFQRKEVARLRDALSAREKPIPAQFGMVNDRQAEEIGRLVNEASLVVRMDSKGFSRFLGDGEMKPSPERAEAPIWYRTRMERERRYGLVVGDPEDSYLQTRREAESELFGAHPVYGYFRSPDAPFNTTTEDSSVFYGNVVVEMKPQVKDRTTWTVGDSLNAQKWLVPSPVGQSDPLSVAPLGPFSPRDYSKVETIDDLFDREWPVLPEAAEFTEKERGNVSMVAEDAGGYAEAQIFGTRPTPDDVARVIFVAPSIDERTWDPDRSNWGSEELETDRYGPTPEQEEALNKAGIPWTFVDAGESFGIVREGDTPYNPPDQTDWKATRRRAQNKPVAPPQPGDEIIPRAVEDAPAGAEITVDPQSGPVRGGFEFLPQADVAPRRLRKREDGRWVELEGPDEGKARTGAWVAKETQGGGLMDATWSAYPEAPRSPGALPDPPESPGWFKPGEKVSPWLPKKKNKLPKAKPPKPKVIGGSSEKPVIGGPFPDYNPVRLTMDKSAGGGNGAMWAKDSAGNRWLVKTYRGNEDRIATELVSNRIYALMGAKVADAGVIEVDDRTALTYKALDGAPRDRVFHTGGPSEAMGEHYMTDALLANWDFAGLTDDNVLWDAEGNPIRIDQGGTLEFRAMGQPKDFGPVPTDVWTMLRKGQAKRASKVTEPQMREQARRIADTLTPRQIDKLMDAAPFRDREMRERVRGNLKARVAWMGAYADGDVDIPQIPQGEAARDEFRQLQSEFEVFPEELGPLNFYARGGALPVQRHLRSKEPVEAADRNVAGAVNALDAILKDSKTREDVIVYVPVDGEAPDGLIGKTVAERGFIHASTDAETAMADGSMVRLTVPAGSHVVDLHELGADLPGDAPEIVVRRGSRMKFTGRGEDGALEATLMPPARPYAPSKAKGAGKGQMGLPGLDGPLEPPKSPGTPKPIVKSLDVDGEKRDVDYTEIFGLPTTTRVYAAFAHGVRPDDEREWPLPVAPVAFLTVDPDKNTLELAYTDERFRRRGLTDSLLQVARLDTGLPLDEDTGERSPMGREWAAAAGIAASPEGGSMNRDLTQEEADKLGERMLTDIGDQFFGAVVAATGSPFTDETVPLENTIRDVNPPEPPKSPGTATDPAFVEQTKKTRRAMKRGTPDPDSPGGRYIRDDWEEGFVTKPEAKKIGQMIADSTLSVRLNSQGLSKFLKEGVMLTSMDRGQRPSWRVQGMKDRGVGAENDEYLMTRKLVEDSLFGASPVYGYFRAPGRTKPSAQDSNAEFYGDVIVELDPKVKDRTTWTVGDSINVNEPSYDDADSGFYPSYGGVVPSPVGGSDPLSVQALGRNAPKVADISAIDDLFEDDAEGVYTVPKYAEAQIFGARPSLGEVKRVVFQAPEYPEGNKKTADYGPNATQARALDKAGIPWELRSWGGKVMKRGKADYEAPDEGDWQRSDEPPFWTGPEPEQMPEIGAIARPDQIAGAPVGSRIRFLSKGEPVEIERRQYGWFLADADTSDYGWTQAVGAFEIDRPRRTSFGPSMSRLKKSGAVSDDLPRPVPSERIARIVQDVAQEDANYRVTGYLGAERAIGEKTGENGVKYVVADMPSEATWTALPTAPAPPQSPGTEPGRTAAVAMDAAQARETLEANNIRVGEPDPKKAVHEASPTFLGTLAYLSSLYPEVGNYLTEVNFASSPTLADSPVDGGPRAGRFAGGVRRSAKAGNWQAQVIKNSAWRNPDGTAEDNHRSKMVYNDLHATPDKPGAYLDDFPEGAVVSVNRKHWRHEGDLWYRIPDKWSTEKVLDENGLATSLTSDDLHRSHSQGHVIGEDDPTHTPAHEFAHGLAGAWTNKSLSEQIKYDWLVQLRRNPSFIEPMSYADFWNVTDQLSARGFTDGDTGWNVFTDAGITMKEIAEVSRYAKSEPSEAFAELFSGHYLGLLSDEVDKKFEALLEKMRAEAKV